MRLLLAFLSMCLVCAYEFEVPCYIRGVVSISWRPPFTCSNGYRVGNSTESFNHHTLTTKCIDNPPRAITVQCTPTLKPALVDSDRTLVNIGLIYMITLLIYNALIYDEPAVVTHKPILLAK